MYLAQGCNTATRVRMEPRPLTLESVVFFVPGNLICLIVLKLIIVSFYWQGTEELLKREACISEADVKQETTTPSESDVSHALAAYKRLVKVRHFQCTKGLLSEPDISYALAVELSMKKVL